MSKPVRNKLTKNAVQCKACGDVIESTHVHEMKWCRCGAIAVDGGLDYLKRAGRGIPDGYRELSEQTCACFPPTEHHTGLVTHFCSGCGEFNMLRHQGLHLIEVENGERKIVKSFCGGCSDAADAEARRRTAERKKGK